MACVAQAGQQRDRRHQHQLRHDQHETTSKALGGDAAEQRAGRRRGEQHARHHVARRGARGPCLDEEQGHECEESYGDAAGDAEERGQAGERAPLRAESSRLPMPRVLAHRLQAEAPQGRADDHRGSDRDEGDERRPMQSQRREHGRHHERAQRVADPTADGEDAHVGGHAAARSVARPAGALGVIGGHPDAGDGDGEQREGIARRVADGADAETGKDEPAGQQPVRLAAVSMGADERLEEGVRDAGGESEHAGGGVAVVPLHDQEGQQREQGARTEVGGAVPQREHEQCGARSRPSAARGRRMRHTAACIVGTSPPSPSSRREAPAGAVGAGLDPGSAHTGRFDVAIGSMTATAKRREALGCSTQSTAFDYLQR